MKKIYTLLTLLILSLSASSLSSKQRAYAGFGKTSKSTGRIKTKSTRGYFKPSNGYKFVNPYARS